jgi:hypothetical protein
METKMMLMLAAIIVYHSIHSIMEMRSVRYKLGKLEAKAGGTQFKEKSFKVDSLVKMMGMMMGMMGMFLVLPFFVFKLLGISTPMLVNISILLIVMVEIVTTMGFNSYHGRIGKVLDKIN